jgi:hypothetical protein
LQTVQQDYHSYFLFAKPPDASRYRQGWADINHVASIITILQTLMAIFLGLMCRKILPLRKPSTPMTPLVWFGFVTAAFGLLISLPISEPFWLYTPGFKYVQFPWRFQPFVALGCGLLAAAAYDIWPTLNPKSRVGIAAALTWVVISNAIFTVMLARLEEPNITRAQAIEFLTAPNAAPVTTEEAHKLLNQEDLKYTPYAANQLYFRPNGSDSNLYPLAAQPGGLAIVSGHGRVLSQKLHIAHREFLIESDEPGRARVETYRYPHWVARVDGREVEIGAEPGSGLMTIDLPAGAHRLTLDYEVRQTSQRIAQVISFLAWAGFLIWIIARAVNRKRRPQGKLETPAR